MCTRDGRVTLANFGEGAVLIDLGIESSGDRAAQTHAAVSALRARFPEADVVIGAGTVLVEGASRGDIAALVEGGGLLGPSAAPPPREHAITVVYDGSDLDTVCNDLHLSRSELIAIHTGRSYTAELLGFLPGFAYLGPLDARLIVPRRAAPRPVVPAGSVGIAGDFTGIYPFACPGGWNLIGRAIDVPLFDPARDPPSLMKPGDRVRFVPSADPGPRSTKPATEIPHRGDRGLVVVQARAMVTVQDRGRRGQLCKGLPPSGPLASRLLGAANAAVGNDNGAAGLEVLLGSLEIEARGAITVSIDGEPLRRLTDGERLLVPSSHGAVRYLAVRGGIEVPRVLGARATLPVASIGGLGGRALRRGDFLSAGEDLGSPCALPSTEDDEDAPLSIDAGPHLDRFPEGALEVLLASEWQVSRLGDRVGVRLEGSAIPRDRPDLALPLPMRRGAVQVTTEGTPIVLGPDHPITGGYPVLAVLRPEAQESLARRRPGAKVRFRLA